jgi:hypothetical protein
MEQPVINAAEKAELPVETTGGSACENPVAGHAKPADRSAGGELNLPAAEALAEGHDTAPVKDPSEPAAPAEPTRGVAAPTASNVKLEEPEVAAPSGPVSSSALSACPPAL